MRKLSRTGDFMVAKFPAPDVRSSAQKQLRQIFVAKWMPDALTWMGIDKPSIERIVGLKRIIQVLTSVTGDVR